MTPSLLRLLNYSPTRLCRFDVAVTLGRSYGQAALRSAIETALALGAGDSAAVRHLLARPSLEHDRSVHVEIGALAAFERPLPELGDYDLLLAVTR